MSKWPVLEEIAEYGVIPVISLDSVEAALPLADALIDGGLPIAEITFRTEAAADALRLLHVERPGLILAAGTVLSVENLERAHACGARFAVAPGLNPDVVRRAKEIEMPLVPGVMTPSEIERGLALGCEVLKFFPSGAAGGPAMVRALSGPYRHTGVRFVPTGGVGPGNLAEYLKIDTVVAVGGTWIAKRSLIDAGNWDAIRDNCREAMEIVRRARA